MRFLSQPSRSLFLLLTLLLMSLTACAGTAAPSTNGNPTESPDEPAAEASAEASPESSAASEESIAEGELVVYSGRNEQLVGPLIEQFEAESGIEVSVRYGDTAEMAALILEEGANSPADLFFAQDAGALGALTLEGRLQPLPEELLSQVEERFRAPGGEWVGVSGRARVIAYNTEILQESDLPGSILDFADPRWSGKLGWAPTNASFQAFVTALRVHAGEEAARAWLEAVQANEPKVYSNNVAVLEAVGSGEIEVGFINHYYLFRKLDEVGESFPARNHFFTNGDIGGLINVAGAAILDSSEQADQAAQFIEYLLSEEAQTYFSEETKEYPLTPGIAADPILPELSELDTPEIDLTQLNDLNGTLELLQELGIL